MSNGRVKVGDLGLGRALGSATMQAFSKVGTPFYMSPEVLKGAGHAFASDVWSLGCVLHELAMLRSPFHHQDATLATVFARIVDAGTSCRRCDDRDCGKNIFDI